MNFPVNDLDMNEFVLDKRMKNVYDLTGVIYHSGSLNGGHYTASCLSSISN